MNPKKELLWGLWVLFKDGFRHSQNTGARIGVPQRPSCRTGIQSVSE